MNEEIFEHYSQAGAIAAAARDYGVSCIKPEVTLLEIASKVEQFILERGAGIAFPVNIAINEVAAHYSPCLDDTKTILKGNLVKLDVGAHVHGYIADTATTINVGTHEYDALISASEESLSMAIKHMKPGVAVSEIGKIIEQCIVSKGFRPIENLTGHSLEQYNLHAGLSIPNVTSVNDGIIKKDDVLAIEPFSTNGLGVVSAGKGSNIYRLTGSFRTRLVRDQRTRFVVTKLNKRFKTLPFAQRWCNEFSNNIDPLLKRLTMLGVLQHYPQLIEKNNGMVAQAEHTVIITDNGCEVIT